MVHFGRKKIVDQNTNFKAIEERFRYAMCTERVIQRERSRNVAIGVLFPSTKETNRKGVQS